ncbi:hypothetical protein ACHAWO_011802 [Cyclotella atomus]|uniref:Uncharacterized protein n=1 Tax=Cyclotella atomus TaxID=382360 RepID=A0ABD3NAN4_9STRA
MAEQQRKQRRKVLTEEDYTSTLTHIVTRDYYPSLYSLRRDAAILEARSRGDVASAVAIRREARREEVERERELMEDQAEELEALSTETALTTVTNAQQVIGIRKRPRLLKHESITGFHARVTSEDNAEFESIQAEESKQREINLGIIYSSSADKSGRLAIEAAVNGMTLPEDTNNRALLGCDTPLGLASDLYNASPSAGLRITGGDGKKNQTGIGRNGLFFQPQHHIDEHDRQTGQHLMLEPSSEAKSTGKFLSLTNDDTVSDNLLMPPPPARKSGNTSIQPADDANKPSSRLLQTFQLVEYQAKPLVPHINPPATRFPNQAESRLTAHNSSRSYTNRQIWDGETDATTDLDEVPPSLEVERAARRQAVINEYETFVPMTPLIQPGGGNTGAELDSEPIMTWGNVASTPLVLGGGVAADKISKLSADWEPTQPFALTDGNSDAVEFDVVEENSREKLAHRAEKKLSDRAKTFKAAGSKASLNKSSKATDFDDASTMSGASSIATAATSRSNFDRSASLTPAARALLEASNKAINATKRIHSQSTSSKSRIFQPSPIVSGQSAASRNSFGSALRMAYTPSSAPSVKRKRSGRDHGSISIMRAAEGSTPRINK